MATSQVPPGRLVPRVSRIKIGVLKSIGSSTGQPGLTDYGMNRNSVHQVSEASLTFERLHRRQLPKSSHGERRDTPNDVDATGRKDLDGEIGRVASENPNKHANGFRA